MLLLVRLELDRSLDAEMLFVRRWLRGPLEVVMILPRIRWAAWGWVSLWTRVEDGNGLAYGSGFGKSVVVEIPE